MKASERRLIDGEVSAEKMDGEDFLTRWINAYLTKRFVYPRDVPSDEYLDESRVIVSMVLHELRKDTHGKYADDHDDFTCPYCVGSLESGE